MTETEWCFTIIADRIEDSSKTTELISLITETIKQAAGSKKEKLLLVFCLRANNDFLKEVKPELSFDNLKHILVYESLTDTYTTEELDISSAPGIEAIFTKYINSKIIAKHHGLMTWGHGGAYSFFEHLLEETKQEYIYQSLKMNNSSETFNNYYYSEKKEQRISDKYLNMDELWKGILMGMKTKKIDIVIMSHCYMAYYETGRMMSKCAQYWVAALGKIKFNSIEVVKNLNFINDSDGVLSPLNLARNIASTPVVDEEKANFFIYDLKNYTALTKCIYSFAGYLIWEIKRNGPDAVHNIRAACPILEETDKYQLLDLTDVCKSTTSIFLKGNKLYNASNVVTEALNKAVIPLNDTDTRRGLSIYFPLSEKDQTTNQIEILGIGKTRGYRKNIWLYFIYIYLLNKKQD